MLSFAWQVYTTLAATVLLSAVGVYIHTLLNIGGIITSLLFVGASTWLMATPSTPQNEVCGSRFALVFPDSECGSP